VPAEPLGVTELAPKRRNWPTGKPNELMLSFSKFMNGVLIVTSVAWAPRKAVESSNSATEDRNMATSNNGD
jgi:hypothetical protein